MATVVATEGWSFPILPSHDASTGVVTYTFDGPVTPNTIEARLYGLRNGDKTQGYFADSDQYAPYSGDPTAVTQVFTQTADTLYSVVIYDITLQKEVLSYLVYPAWQVIDRVPKRVPQGVEFPHSHWETLEGTFTDTAVFPGGVTLAEDGWSFDPVPTVSTGILSGAWTGPADIREDITPEGDTYGGATWTSPFISGGATVAATARFDGTALTAENSGTSEPMLRYMPYDAANVSLGPEVTASNAINSAMPAGTHYVQVYTGTTTKTHYARLFHPSVAEPLGPVLTVPIKTRVYHRATAPTSKEDPWTLVAEYDTNPLDYDGSAQTNWNGNTGFASSHDYRVAVFLGDRIMLDWHLQDEVFTYTLSNRIQRYVDQGFYDAMGFGGVKHMTVVRTWGDDDRVYDSNGDGVPDFPLRANMRWGRERRRRAVFIGLHEVNPPTDITMPQRTVDVAVRGNRIWGGIGGFSYIPSFPQLNRKLTTWPTAI